MQAPFQLYLIQFVPGPPPPPSQPQLCSGARYGTLTHRGLSRPISGPRSCEEPLSDVPVNFVASAARNWLAGCQEPHQVAAGLQRYAPLLRVQGWTLLIADCGKRGEADKAREVFKAVPLKNVWHHSAFIAALGACEQWKEALAALQHLKQLAFADRSLRPNHVTYSAAIAACARVRRLDNVMQLFHEMQAAGLTPDSVTYAIVLSTASRLGAWVPVEQLLEAMHSRGIPARPPIYAAYLRQLCRVGQWNRALSLFLVMQDLDVPATPMMVLDLVQALHRCNRPHMAAHLLKEAEQAGLDDLLGAYRSNTGPLECLQANGGLHEKHNKVHQQAAPLHSRSWPPPPPRPPQQQQQQQGAQHARAAAGAAATGSKARAAAAAACGGDVCSAVAADTADASSGSDGTGDCSGCGSGRQDSLLQHLEACFEQCSIFNDDDGASVLQSDAETEEYACSFASSSELSSSVATATLARLVLHDMPLVDGACCTSSCSSSTLPSPLRSPLAQPMLAPACTPAGPAAAAGSAAIIGTCAGEQQQQQQLRGVAAAGITATAAVNACCACGSASSEEQEQRADAIICNA